MLQGILSSDKIYRQQTADCVQPYIVARDAVRNIASVDGGLALEKVHTAADGTRKLIFRLISGGAPGATVETVLIPIVRRGGERQRMTVCVSSQVGCAMNCQFCYTGRMGLTCVPYTHCLNRPHSCRALLRSVLIM